MTVPRFRIFIAATTALHPDSVRSFNITLNSDLAFVEQWEATPGSSEMQEITALQGLELSSFKIEGIMEDGEYLGILEVRSRLLCQFIPEQTLFARSSFTRTNTMGTLLSKVVE